MSNTSSGSELPEGLTPDLWEAWLNLRRGCYPDLIDGVDPSYGYRPTLGAGIAFDVLFGICIIGHLIQLIRFRRWTSGLMMTGAISAYNSFLLFTWFFWGLVSSSMAALTHVMSTGLSCQRPMRWIMFHRFLHIIHSPNCQQLTSTWTKVSY